MMAGPDTMRQHVYSTSLGMAGLLFVLSGLVMVGYQTVFWLRTAEWFEYDLEFFWNFTRLPDPVLVDSGMHHFIAWLFVQPLSYFFFGIGALLMWIGLRRV